MKHLRDWCISSEFSRPVLQIRGAIEPIALLVPPQAVSTSVHLLRYRGVPYLQAIHQIDLTQVNLEALYQLKNKIGIEAIDQVNLAQPMGWLYRLYCMGWRNGSLQCFSQVQHRLLSLFWYYRKGYAAGIVWGQHD